MTGGSRPATALVGYAAKWGTVAPVRRDGHFERVAKGAFAGSIATDDVRAMADHVPHAMLGRRASGTLMVGENRSGLAFALPLPNTSTGNDVAALVRRGDMRGASFAFRTVVDEWSMLEKYQLRTLLQGRLCDVGPSLAPVYGDTSVALRPLAEGWPGVPNSGLQDPLAATGDSRSAATARVEVRGDKVRSWARYVVVAHVPGDRGGPSRVRLLHTDSADAARSASDKVSSALEMRSSTARTDPAWSVTVCPGSMSGGVTVRSLVKGFLS